MAATERFSLVIDSKTTGTAEIEKLTAALTKAVDVADRGAKKTEEAVKSTGESVRSIASSVENAISSPLSTAKGHVESFVLSTGKIGAVSLGAVAGITALSVAAFEMVASAGKAAEGMINFADRTGLTVNQAAKLAAMAKIAGVDIGALEASSRVLATALEDTAGGGAKAQRALAKLGIAVYDASGNEREMGQVTLELLEKLSAIASTAERVAIANAVLGRGAKEILPLITNYTELKKTVEELGVGVSDSLTRELAKADDEIDKLEISFSKLKKTLAGKLAPIVVTVIQKVSTQLQTDNIFELGFGAHGPLYTKSGPGSRVDVGTYDEAINDPYDALTQGDIASALKRLGLPSAPTIPSATSNAMSRERARWEASIKGLEEQKAALEKSVDEAHRKLISGTITGPSQVASLETQRDADIKSLEKVEARIKEITDAESNRNKAIAARKRILDEVSQFETRAAEQALNPLAKLSIQYDAQVKKLRELGATDKDIERLEAAFKKQWMAEFQKGLDESRKRTDDLTGALERLRGAADDAVNESLFKNIFSDPRSVISKAFNPATFTDIPLSETTDQYIARIRSEAQRNARSAAARAPFGMESSAAGVSATIQLKAIDDIRNAEIERINATYDDGFAKETALHEIRLKYADEEANIRSEWIDRLYELQKERDNRIRQSAGELFDALKAGGAGFRQFFEGQATLIGKTLFQNISVEFTKGMSGKFALPGQTTNGQLNTFGRILQGTPFGLAPESIAANTQLSAAQIQMTAATTFAGAVTGVSGGATAAGISRVFGGYQGGGIFNFGGGAASIPFGSFSSDLGGGYAAMMGYPITPTKTGTSPLVKGIGYGAVIAAGGMGVYSGIRQGGAQGTLTAVASGLGTAAALDPEPISKAILGVAAMAAGIGAALFGDPKKKEAERLENERNARSFTEPTGTSYVSDIYGRTIDYDYTGRTRGGATVINNYVNAVDAPSFVNLVERNGTAVTSVVTKTVSGGNAEDLVGTLRQIL